MFPEGVEKWGGNEESKLLLRTDEIKAFARAAPLLKYPRVLGLFPNPPLEMLPFEFPRSSDADYMPCP